jgi:uncharacterized membrane protein YgcG
MALRQPRTAILTVTLLAAASANPARAIDCEQLREQLVGQYGVVMRYGDGVTFATQRCDQILAAKVLDQTAFTQCTASLQNLQASYQQANATYLQQYGNYHAQCTTTATYGAPGNPAAPSYATNDPNAANPYDGQPSEAITTPAILGTGQDAQTINSFFGFNGGSDGWGAGIRGGIGRGGGSSRGGGSKRPC